MSYPVRDLAFETAYEAYDCDNEPDAPCQNEDNEPLFQALMTKVGSYHPEEEAYQAEAYARAAQNIGDLEDSVFDLTDKEQRRLGGGSKTNQFIYHWIQTAKEAQLMDAQQPSGQEDEQAMSHLEDEFFCLQRHIQDLMRFTKDKPAYGSILQSLYVQANNMYELEKAERQRSSPS